MGKNFWLVFAIQEAVTIATAFIMASNALTPEQKVAAEKLVADGQALLATL